MTSENKKVRDMTKKELMKGYYYHANSVVDSTLKNNTARQAFMANAHIDEIKRRESKRSNRIMIFCTIAITIMTVVILWATLVGAEIISCGG